MSKIYLILIFKPSLFKHLILILIPFCFAQICATRPANAWSACLESVQNVGDISMRIRIRIRTRAQLLKPKSRRRTRNPNHWTPATMNFVEFVFSALELLHRLEVRLSMQNSCHTISFNKNIAIFFFKKKSKILFNRIRCRRKPPRTPGSRKRATRRSTPNINNKYKSCSNMPWRFSSRYRFATRQRVSPEIPRKRNRH
jgi:hypothetical protein